MSGKIILKPGKEKPLVNRHPWIFSGAVAKMPDAPDGETVEVLSAGGEWLARAGFNAHSQIVGRVWTFEQDEPVDRAFFARRMARAAQFRPAQDSALRLVNAESDGLPGIVIDRYADFLVAQSLTAAAERHKADWVGVLQEHFAPKGIYERSDVDVRKKEGLAEVTGALAGETPPARLEIVENGAHFWVDVRRGHKTGFYLDQRTNRARAAPYLRGAVLNAFAYTGAFGVYAARQNQAAVLNLDASSSALELAKENFALNQVAALAAYAVGDAFQKLREYRSAGRTFDAIVLDPPKFVTSHANLDRATRGYKDLNLLAFQLLNPGGALVTFSCSGLVSPELLQKIVFGAMVDAGRDARIVEKLGQPPDHPIGLGFPEGEYLKGLIVRVN